jgi:lipopolysaccharide heptosyltransferase I
MPESQQRFLVIRLSSIGDIVHTLPAVSALGRTYPQAEIHWVVETRYAGLLEGNPYVRSVLKLDTLGWRRHVASAATVEETLRGLRALRESSYEAAIDFQGLWKSAFLAWLSRARERLGLAEYWLREPGAAVFYTERVSARGRTHVVDQYLALAERLGAREDQWEFPLPHTAEDDRYVERQLALLGAEEFIIVNPGGGWQEKCWAPENYAELLRALEARLPWKILLTGSTDEYAVISEILKSAGARRAHYLASTLVQFIALARRARLFVGGDTGPLHLAAAVGTPVVAIYGPTDPARNGPFAAGDIALSGFWPINHHMRRGAPHWGLPSSRKGRHGTRPSYLTGVPVEAVLRAITERLARAHG